MAVSYKQDYVFSPKVWPGALTDAFFIGTKNYLFAYPLKTTEISSRKMIDSTFTIGGAHPSVHFSKLLDNPETTIQTLEEELIKRSDDFEEVFFEKISDHAKLRVTVNFFTNIIMIGDGKIGFNTYTISHLGKKYKHDIKEFYADISS
jgi:hypothetical protein